MLSDYKSLTFIAVILIFLTSCHTSRQAASVLEMPPSRGAKAAESASAKRPRTEAPNGKSRSKPLGKKALKRKYAALLNTSPGQIKNRRLYSFIDDWYGVKYKWGGNDQSGVDCSGLVCQLYKDVYGVKVKRTVATQHDGSRNFRRKRRLKEGDLVYFKTAGKGPSHVGVYLQNRYFLHSSEAKGVSITSMEEPYWKRTYINGGKVKKKKD